MTDDLERWQRENAELRERQARITAGELGRCQVCRRELEVADGLVPEHKARSTSTSACKGSGKAARSPGRGPARKLLPLREIS